MGTARPPRGGGVHPAPAPQLDGARRPRTRGGSGRGRSGAPRQRLPVPGPCLVASAGASPACDPLQPSSGDYKLGQRQIPKVIAVRGLLPSGSARRSPAPLDIVTTDLEGNGESLLVKRGAWHCLDELGRFCGSGTQRGLGPGPMARVGMEPREGTGTWGCW